MSLPGKLKAAAVYYLLVRRIRELSTHGYICNSMGTSISEMFERMATKMHNQREVECNSIPRVKNSLPPMSLHT